MSGAISTGSVPKANKPGVRAWWGRFYNEHSKEYPDLFELHTSSDGWEEDVQVTGFGLPRIKNQGDKVHYDSESQGYIKRYTMVTYGLGYIVTREEIEDGKYMKVSKGRIQALAFSMNQSKENVAANVYNRATAAAYTGGDGSVLMVSTHSTRAGNQSNIIPTNADISEAALEDLAIMIMKAKNDRGLQIALKPQSLHVHPNDWFEANRIVKSTLQNDTANNALNVIKSTGVFPGGIKVNHYFTDTDAFFVRTNCPNSMKFYTRRAIEFTNDNDFDTENAKHKATERYECGWTDWRGLFGSPGA